MDVKYAWLILLMAISSLIVFKFVRPPVENGEQARIWGDAQSKQETYGWRSGSGNTLVYGKNQAKSVEAEELKLLHYPEYKYPHILECENEGEMLRFVATQLLITSIDGEKSLDELDEVLLRKELNLEQVSRKTWLLSWSEPSVEHFLQYLSEWTVLLSEVAVVEPDFVLHSCADPNDPLMELQWYMDRIEANAAWDIRRNASEILVTVMDTGIDDTHPDLAANIYENTSESVPNLVDDDGNGFVDDARGWDFVDEDAHPFDLHGHGTAMAGIIGAVGNNSTGLVGVAWDVQLVAVRILDEQGIGYTSDLLAAVDYVANTPTNIVNASFGHSGYSFAEEVNFQMLQDEGIVVVAASGNEGLDTSRYPIYPAALELDNIISVGAANGDNQVASFSNYGDNVDIFAPGVSIYGTNLKGEYFPVSGTSPATAIISGAVALLQSEYPSLSMEDLKSRIMDRAIFSKELEGRCAANGSLSLYHSLADTTFSGPILQEQTGGGVVSLMGEIVLSFSAKCYGEQTIIWYKDGEIIAGENGTQLVVNMESSLNTGVYYAEIRDRYGVVTTEPFYVQVVQDPPRIESISTESFIASDEPLYLSVRVSGVPPFTYEWYRNDVLIPDTNSATLKLTDEVDNLVGDYRVRISNVFGFVDSPVIPVSQLSSSNLDWLWNENQNIGLVNRVGDVYFRHDGRYSSDLTTITQPKGEARGIPIHAEGYFWQYDGYKKLYRSQDGINRELYAQLPTSAGEYFAVGNGVAIVTGHKIYRIPLEGSPVQEFDNGMYFGRVYFYEGKFESLGPDHTIYQSVDGVIWQPVAGREWLVVHRDESSGKYVGYDGRIQKHAVSDDLEYWRLVELEIGYPRVIGNGFIFDDHRAFDIDTEKFVWVADHPYKDLVFHDTQFRYTIENGKHQLLDISSGIESEIIYSDLLEGIPMDLNMNGKEFGDSMLLGDCLVDSSGNVIPLEVPYRAGYLAATDSFALYHYRSKNEFWRLSKDGEFTPLNGNPPDGLDYYCWSTDSLLYASYSDIVHVSTDGEFWTEYSTPENGWIVGHDDYLISVEFDEGYDDFGVYFGTALVKKLDFTTGDWQTVVEYSNERVPHSDQHFISGTFGFIITNLGKTYFSEDGTTWQESYVPEETVRELKRKGKFIFAQCDIHDYATVDGINWFPAEMDLFPQVEAGALALRDAWIARSDGYPFHVTPVIQLIGERFQRTPAEWRCRVLPDHAGDVERIELVLNNQVVDISEGPGVAELSFSSQIPGSQEFQAIIYYRDGWITRSFPLTFHAGIQVDPVVYKVDGYIQPIGLPGRLRYYDVPDGIFALTFSQDEIYFSQDGLSWEPATLEGFPELTNPGFVQLGTGETVMLRRYPSNTEIVGHIRSENSSEWTALATPILEFEGTWDTHLIAGELYLLFPDGSRFVWEQSGWKELPDVLFLKDLVTGMQSPAWVRVYSPSGDSNVFMMQVGSGYFATTDFEHFQEVNILENWTHLTGTWFQHDHQPILGQAADLSGELTHHSLLPVRLESMNWLNTTTFTGSDYSGMQWVGDVQNGAVPISNEGLTPRSIIYESSHILFLYENGEILRFGGYDLSVRSCEIEKISEGVTNVLHVRMQLQNQGILRFGANEKVQVRIWLDTGHSYTGLILLDEIDLMLNSLMPSIPQTFAFAVVMPSTIDLGEYKLLIELDPDDQFLESDESNNQAISPVFAFNPNVSLQLSANGLGWISSSHLSTSLPYGTVVSLQAVNESGQSFIGWTGFTESESAQMEVDLRGSTSLMAHFLPDQLLGLFPDLHTIDDGKWYAEQIGPEVWNGESGWAFIESLGWSFPLGEKQMYFYMPDTGWFKRIDSRNVFYHFDSSKWYLYEPGSGEFWIP